MNPITLTGRALTIYNQTVGALQPAEELGGPENVDYTSLMLTIASEAIRRAAAFVTSAPLEIRIADALGTAERGENLVAVARAAARSERELAALQSRFHANVLEYLDDDAAYVLHADGTAQRVADNIEVTLEYAQKLVGGYVELLWASSHQLLINEEGKLRNLPVNVAASKFFGRDLIVGTALVLTGARRWT